MGTFLYFGYGSNLLRQRLRLQNPSAKFVTTALLKDYQLTFTCVGDDPLLSRWHGAAATIRSTTGHSLWGCVWEIGNEHKETLDEQEAVYNPIEVTVTGSDDNIYICRTYQFPNLESNMADDDFKNRPSPFYMDVIIKGAKQNGICLDYVNFLENIKTNGITEVPEVYEDTMKLLTADGV